MATPDIFQYTDFRDYLKDWLKLRKPKVSMRAFAKRVHVSPSLLSQILHGKRTLDESRVDTFCKALKLDDRESAYFRALVDYAQSASPTRRAEALEFIEVTRGFHQAARMAADSAFQLLSKWYYSAIAELARCEGFLESPAWIAARLVPRITEEQAAEALTFLEGRGFLGRDAEGRLAPSAEGATVTDHEVYQEAVSRGLTQQHLWTLNKASEGLKQFNGDERAYACMTMAMPEEQLPELKARLNQFLEETIHYVEGQEAPDRVYQLGFQLYPLTARTDEKPDEG